MIIALTFTYPPDAREAYRNSEYLPSSWNKRWVVESEHYEAVSVYAKLANAELLVDDFDRGKTLRGVDAVKGVIRNLTSFNADCVVKIDSDVALWDTDAIVSPILNDGVALCGIARGNGVSGACYAISKVGIELLKSVSESKLITAVHKSVGHEDLSISKLIAQANLPRLIYSPSRMNPLSYERKFDQQILGHKI